MKRLPRPGRNVSIALLVLCGTALAVKLEAYEWLHEQTRSFERYEVDELLFATPFLASIGLALLAWQHARDTRRELHRCKGLVDAERGRTAVLKLLAGGASLQEVLTKLVETVEAGDTDMLCSVLLLDDQRKHLRHGAAPSLPEFYTSAVDGLEIGPDVGSCGAAASANRRVIVEDILTHPNWAPFREIAVRAGLRACWSEPIRSGAGDVVGTFAIYYREPRAPTAGDLDTIRSAAHLAGIAIENERAGKAAAASEEQFKELFESAGDVILVGDANGNIIDINRKAEKLTGYSRDELVGSNLLTKLIVPEDRAAIAHVLNSLTQGDDQTYQVRWIAKDGHIIPFEGNSSARFSEDGTFQSTRCILRDVTDRKRIEAVKDAHYRVLDLLSRDTSLEDILTELVESTERATPGIACMILLHDEGSNCLRLGVGPSVPDWCREVADGLTMDSAARFFRRAGEFDVAPDGWQSPENCRFASECELAIACDLHSGSCTFIRSQAGQAIGLFVVFRAGDVHPDESAMEWIDAAVRISGIAIERRRIQDTLRVREAEIRALIADIDAIVWEADPDSWKFSFVSKRAEAILGYPVEQWLDDAEFWVNIVHPDDRDEAVAACLDASAKGEDHAFEYRALAADGRVVWMRDLVRITEDEKGRRHLRGLMVDITESKRAERRLLDQAAALEAANKALEEAHDEAEAASRAKSEFLANMSHEIRTPMTAILGFADVLRTEGDLSLAPELRIGAIDAINRNAEHLLSIINNILDLSKIEAGKMSIEGIPCSPCRIVAEVVSLMRVRAEGKALSLDVEYSGPIPEVIRTDPTRLRQILINLIGNAIKFTRQGGVRLEIRFSNGTGSNMEFDVVDTGIGVAKELVGSLFQPFSQADASTTRVFGGTGLGLTISRRFAKLLGGDITIVETCPGVGTRFRVTIATGPLDGVTWIDDPAVATVISGTSERRSVDAHERVLRDRRVLLAEDGPDNQRLIAHVLKVAGADVTVAENGQVAVDAALRARDEGKPFDVILMDIQMPVMDGYEATALLRRRGYSGSVIALTAHAMASDRQRCLDAGCDDYATKPIDRVTLVEVIRASLDRVAAASE